LNRNFYIFIFSLIFLSSCKKEISNVGIDALGVNGTLLGGVDTFSVSSSIYKQDTVSTSNPSYLLLGSYKDPKFGSVKTGFCSQLILSTSNPNFGDLNDLSVDSCVLGINYVDYYGKLTPQTFEVYELSQQLDSSATYYSNSISSSFPTNLIETPGISITPRSLGEYFVTSTGDTIRNSIRIRLSKQLATKWITDATNNPSYFSSVYNFKKYFKGLQVNVNNTNQTVNDGAVFTIGESPVITIYYTQLGIQKKYTFLMSKSAIKYNQIQLNNTGTEVEKLILGQDIEQKFTYAQSNSLRAKFSFPYLTSLPKNTIIHSAKLVLPIDYYKDDSYYPSNTINVSIPNSLTDSYLRGIGTADFDTLTKSYIIDIREHIQSVVIGKRLNLPVIVSPQFFSNSAERIVFHGSKNEIKPKLYLKFSTY
jgi:hypothetical protein